MKIIRRPVLFLAILLGASAAFSYDFSAIVTDSTRLDFYEGKFKDPLLKQSEKFIGAFSVPLFSDGVSNFAAEASVEHKYDRQFGDVSDSENSLIFDCTLFKFSTEKKLSVMETVELHAGRFFFSDLSGIVVAQPGDGVFAKYASAKMEISAYGGYSGLLNVKNVSVLTSNGEVWGPEDENDNYDFTAPYAVGSLCVSFPYFLKNQTISFECLGIFNVEGPGNLEDDDRRIYGTLNLTGPLSGAIFYTLNGTFGTSDFDKVGILGHAGINYFSSYKNASIGLNAFYASGKKGNVESFVGFTKFTACLSAQEPVYTELFKMGVNGSIMPFTALVVSAGCDLVYRMPENSSEFYGIQVNGGAIWKVYSDFNVSLSVSQFVGKYEEASRTEMTLGIALAI